MRLGLLRIGYLTGEQAATQAAIDALEGTTFAVRSLGIQQAHACAGGRFRSTEALQARADEIARRQNLGSAALTIKLDGMTWRANAGLCAEVDAAATPDVLERDLNRAPAVIAAVATCGRAATAQDLVAALAKTGKHGQVWHEAQLPLIKARVLLTQQRPADAIAALEPARVFDRGVTGVVLARGEAYLQSGKATDAAREFRKILTVKANLLRSDYNGAQVGLARALAASGDHAAAARAYESFFDLWESADDDVPLLVAARREYARLPRLPGAPRR